MEYVSVDDPCVKRAIKFVKDQTTLCMKQFPSSFLESNFKELPWVYYIPADTPEDKQERELLIEKYRNTNPQQIQYYLLYHNCDDFAVFYWTVLRANEIKSNIIHQTNPFHHTYLQKETGEVLDILLFYCDVSYPYDPENASKFETPHDFYAKIFISKKDQRPWEIELLKQLKDLE